MRPDDRISYVRGLMPRTVIGEHAVGHWETAANRRGHRLVHVSYREQQRRATQSVYDRTRFHLRRSLEMEPHRLGELNSAIKAGRMFDEDRRLLLGMHDIDAFVATIVKCPARYAVERACVAKLINNVRR